MNNYNDIIKKVEIRNKFINLGLGCIGPRGLKGEKGDKGDKGDAGPVISSSNEGLFFADFNDIKNNGEVNFNNSWTLPNPSSYFTKINESMVSLSKGIYEITMSGLISGVDATHSAEIYLSDLNNTAIKDLDFNLNANNAKQMDFSRSIILRFEEDITLKVNTNITGDALSSNVVISGVNLYFKKLHE